MIKVHGYPRSGNNLLAKYVADTFYPDEDTAVHNVRWGHWSNRIPRKSVPYGKCLGSHLAFPKGALYIVRDTADVAYSIWRSDGFKHKSDKSTFSEFIRKPLDWHFTPSVRSYDKKTVIQDHADYMVRSTDGVWIDYNILTMIPEQVMEYISRTFDIEMKQFNVIDKPIGYSPNYGKEKQISHEDRQYIAKEFAKYMHDQHGQFWVPKVD